MTSGSATNGGRSARESSIVWSATQLPDALDDAVTFRVGIESNRGPEFHREVAAVLDRIDHDHLAGAGDARGLNGAEADRSGTEDDDVGAWLEAHVRVTGGKT